MGSIPGRPFYIVFACAIIALAVVLGSAGTAMAVPPSVIDTTSPAYGRSAWTYQDLGDVSPKYEGGYAAFDDTATATFDDPHGGYDTSTNKCKVCHGVHRAEGAYYLLRADSQDDACDYCHLDSGHSDKIVYDLNPAGKATTNGHTIGASAAIPDSTEEQWAEDVVLSTADADGNTITETIQVRAYSEVKATMYRFARHHGHRAPGTGRSGYDKIGPLALRCMSCHHVHNATDQVWAPAKVINYYGGTHDLDTPAEYDSYKLLKAYPSGATTGTVNSYGYYDASQAVRVPEATLTANVNYSTQRGMGFVNPATGRAVPNWVAQDFIGKDTLVPETGTSFCSECHVGHGGPYVYNTESELQRPYAVNNTALSVWCADCHNLNIGYWKKLTSEELGFKAHSERTHPVPYVGGHSGPGQCYSCHRSDLNVTQASCQQCHYGTGDYWYQRVVETSPVYVASDFPHSGDTDSVKLLGSYSVVNYTGVGQGTINANIAITEDNLDAVCVRCHGGIGEFH